MGHKIGLKALAILIALVMVASSFAMYGYSGTDVKNGMDERGEKGVISLMPPPFVGVAGAAEAAGGGGGAATAGRTFLEEEAGISAYVNVGQQIDLEKAETAFKSIETANESYIIGEIDIPGLPEDVDPHAYVHKDGWIVAYYSKYAPASKIMQWVGYGGGTIATTTLADAIHQICTAIQVSYTPVKGNIEYYDFEYPNANRMMLITDMVTGGYSDSFNLTIPLELEYQLYEGSWSHCFFKHSSTYDSHNSLLEIDGDTLSIITKYGMGTYFQYGEYTAEQLEVSRPHEISIKQQDDDDTTGVAVVLIYRTS